NADILVLDEPTAVLTPQEASELFGILRILRREGASIIFISHQLNEVLEIAERITVLRRGRKIETVPRAGATEGAPARPPGRRATRSTPPSATYRRTASGAVSSSSSRSPRTSPSTTTPSRPTRAGAGSFPAESSSARGG